MSSTVDDDPTALLASSALAAAPRLLGAVIRHVTPKGAVAVRLSEVEAYEGELDPGSHAFRGPTRRNQVMFGEPGHLYVYRHLGLHHCVNVVCGPAGRASAVLLRAGGVVEGVELARARRSRSGVTRDDADLARGPARLTVALGLDLEHNGAALSPHGPLSLSLPRLPPAGEISTGPRVGVNGAGGDGEAFPWRFWIAGDPTVSAFRKGAARPANRRRTR